MIRPAAPGDSEAIAAIWNALIRDTAVTFTTAEKDPRELARQIVSGAPFLVAEDDGAVAGFVTASQFRGGPGYAHTFEHSVHVAAPAQGKGLGRALMATLEAELRMRDVHSVFAGVSGENAGGIGFHAAMGYREVARLPEVGRKFGRWHDLVLMQKML